jgi:hypothetical protein
MSGQNFDIDDWASTLCAALIAHGKTPKIEVSKNDRGGDWSIVGVKVDGQLVRPPLAVGDAVEIGTAYRMGQGQVADEWTGTKWFVVTEAGADAGLARRADDVPELWCPWRRLRRISRS